MVEAAVDRADGMHELDIRGRRGEALSRLQRQWHRRLDVAGVGHVPVDALEVAAVAAGDSMLPGWVTYP